MEGSTLRIDVLEARDLLAKNGTATPYAVATVGSQSRATKTVSNSLSPAWNEQLALYPVYT